MNPQELLFHESFEDAIGAVIARCGGRKAMGAELFPDKAPREAHNMVDACLNPERRERFTPSQLLFIARKGREKGAHDIMRFLCAELGYEDIRPIEPRDEAAELMRDYIAAANALSLTAARMEKAASRAGLRVAA